MSRRSTPERLQAARRAAALARLISDGELPDRADIWMARGERQAAQDGREPDSGYWEAKYRWIAARRRPAVVGNSPGVIRLEQCHRHLAV